LIFFHFFIIYFVWYFHFCRFHAFLFRFSFIFLFAIFDWLFRRCRFLIHISWCLWLPPSFCRLFFAMPYAIYFFFFFFCFRRIISLLIIAIFITIRRLRFSRHFAFFWLIFFLFSLHFLLFFYFIDYFDAMIYYAFRLLLLMPLSSLMPLRISLWYFLIFILILWFLPSDIDAMSFWLSLSGFFSFSLAWYWYFLSSLLWDIFASFLAAMLIAWLYFFNNISPLLPPLLLSLSLFFWFDWLWCHDWYLSLLHDWLRHADAFMMRLFSIFRAFIFVIFWLICHWLFYWLFCAIFAMIYLAGIDYFAADADALFSADLLPLRYFSPRHLFSPPLLYFIYWCWLFSFCIFVIYLFIFFFVAAFHYSPFSHFLFFSLIFLRWLFLFCCHYFLRRLMRRCHFQTFSYFSCFLLLFFSCWWCFRFSLLLLILILYFRRHFHYIISLLIIFIMIFISLPLSFDYHCLMLLYFIIALSHCWALCRSDDDTFHADILFFFFTLAFIDASLHLFDYCFFALFAAFACFILLISLLLLHFLMMMLLDSLIFLLLIISLIISPLLIDFHYFSLFIDYWFLPSSYYRFRQLLPFRDCRRRWADFHFFLMPRLLICRALFIFIDYFTILIIFSPLLSCAFIDTLFSSPLPLSIWYCRCCHFDISFSMPLFAAMLFDMILFHLFLSFHWFLFIFWCFSPLHALMLSFLIFLSLLILFFLMSFIFFIFIFDYSFHWSFHCFRCCCWLLPFWCLAIDIDSWLLIDYIWWYYAFLTFHFLYDFAFDFISWDYFPFLIRHHFFIRFDFIFSPLSRSFTFIMPRHADLPLYFITPLYCFHFSLIAFHYIADFRSAFHYFLLHFLLSFHWYWLLLNTLILPFLFIWYFSLSFAFHFIWYFAFIFYHITFLFISLYWLILLSFAIFYWFSFSLLLIAILFLIFLRHDIIDIWFLADISLPLISLFSFISFRRFDTPLITLFADFISLRFRWRFYHFRWYFHIYVFMLIKYAFWCFCVLFDIFFLSCLACFFCHFVWLFRFHFHDASHYYFSSLDWSFDFTFSLYALLILLLSCFTISWGAFIDALSILMPLYALFLICQTPLITPAYLMLICFIDWFHFFHFFWFFFFISLFSFFFISFIYFDIFITLFSPLPIIFDYDGLAYYLCLFIFIIFDDAILFTDIFFFFVSLHAIDFRLAADAYAAYYWCFADATWCW